MLFDDIIRDYHEPAYYSENEFSFLNRSARPSVARIREVLEKWYQDYPKSEQQKLKSRFRSEFQAAFFELFVHSPLKSLQCSVELHPQMGTNRQTRPDFLAVFPDGVECYIEARVITDVSEEENRKENRMNRLYDELDRLDSSDFFLGLKDLHDEGDRQPSGKRLRTAVAAWLDGLDPDEVTDTLTRVGMTSMPSLNYQEKAFKVTVYAIPKRAEARGKQGVRAIGISPIKTRRGGTAPAIKSGLTKKAGKYGRIHKPYVIAINCISPWGWSPGDVQEALFGTDHPEHLFADIPTSRPQSTGLWNGPQGPQNKRVSAVLLTSVFPSSISVAEVVMFQNPFADYPCRKKLWRIKQVSFVNGVMETSGGTTLADLFDLRANWPGPLFANGEDV